MRDRLPNQSFENLNRSPFASNIRHAKNLSDYKVPTIKMYDKKTDPTINLMSYICHTEVLDASEEVMR